MRVLVPWRLISVAALVLCAACEGAEDRDAAALEGLSNEPAQEAAASVADPPSVDAWLALHRLAQRPNDPRWGTALGTLAAYGDGFTLARLEEIDRVALSTEQRERLDRTTAAVRERVAQVDDNRFVDGIVDLLERSAWADLKCDPFEDTLRSWTKQTVAARRDSSAVRAELERIEHEYAATGQDAVGFGTMTDRVRRYAREIQAHELD